MASPGDKRYQDTREKSLKHLHEKIRKKKTLWLQKIIRPFASLLLLPWRGGGVGKENLPEGGYILASSHRSTLDPFLLAFALAIPPINFVAKSQLFRFPLINTLVQLGAFPIKRGTYDEEAFETSLRVLENGHHLIVFPQGGINKGLSSETARWGAGLIALRSGVPIVPVWIEGEMKLLKKTKIYFGKPMQIAHNDNPTKEENIKAAQKILQAIAKTKECSEKTFLKDEPGVAPSR